MSTTIGCQIPGASQPKEPVRLIDAYALKKRCVKVMFRDTPECGEFYAVGTGDIDIMPTIDPESLRPTAHWIKRGYVCEENEYECSACHQTEWRTSASRMKYCMFCGARMVNTDEKHCT